MHTVFAWHLETKASVGESLIWYRLECSVWKRARPLVLKSCNF